MIGIIRIKIKIPDSNANDKEWNELIKKYLDIIPPKSFRASKYSDGWEFWL